MEKLDLVILLDNHWSVNSFISAGANQLKKRIESGFKEINIDSRFACIEYADKTNYPARSKGFSTCISDFNLQKKIDSEDENTDALTTGIEEAFKLDWRKDARKICFIITDSPPLCLFTDSKPGIDLLQLTRQLGQMGVVLNTIGIEPRLEPYKDFFMALSYITGGRFITLTDPSQLPMAIVGAAQEDLSLERILHLVDKKAVDCIRAIGPTENDIGKFYNGCDQHFIDFYKDLSEDGKTPETFHLMAGLEGVRYISALARYLSSMNSMSDIKKICPTWPLPWPARDYEYLPPPRMPIPYPPPPCAPASEPKFPSASPIRAKPPPPPPPPPPPTMSKSTSSTTASITSIAPGPLKVPGPFCPPPAPRMLGPPPPPVYISLAPPPPPHPLPTCLPLRRQWPPNPREPPSTGTFRSTKGKNRTDDEVSRPSVPFDGAFFYRKQSFGIMRSPPTYGQVHRLVQRVLVRKLLVEQ